MMEFGIPSWHRWHETENRKMSENVHFHGSLHHYPPFNLPYHIRSGWSARLPSRASGCSPPTSLLLFGSSFPRTPPHPLPSVRRPNPRPPKIDLTPPLIPGTFTTDDQLDNSISRTGVKKRSGSADVCFFTLQHLTGFVRIAPVAEQQAAADRWATRLSKRSDLLNPFSYRGRSEKADFTEGFLSSRRRAGTTKPKIHCPKRIIEQKDITPRYQNSISSAGMTCYSLIS